MRFKMTREFYIPKDSSPVEFEEKGCVVYLTDRDESYRLPFVAMGFSGRKQKPDFNFGFPTKEKRDEYIEKWITSIRNWEKEKIARREEKKSKSHNFKEGDILTGSWGYDQTNQEFYEVVETKGKSIYIREIGVLRVESQGSQDRVIPDPSSGSEKILRKIPQSYSGDSWYVKFDHFSLSKWCGEARYATAFGYGH